MPEHLDTIGPYRVVRPIARGGMAEVYEVQDTKSGAHLALKLLLETGSALPRFNREYEAMIRLNHPNIVQVYNYGFQGDNPWFTMEMVHGTPVQAHVKSLGRPGTETRMREVLRIGHDIALALDHISYRGLVHRDLKSANVLVLPDGRVKLIDFGTARVIDAMEPITQDGEFVGTFAYASPEQIRGRPIDHRSDLYSLGVLLYRLCTGRRPFDADDIRVLARKVIKDAPRPPTELVDAVPEALEEVILHLLAKKPAGRIQSGRRLARLLRQIAGDSLSVPGTLDVRAAGEILVGREDQLAALRYFLTRAVPGSAVLVVGPAGSGRDRLIRAAEQDVDERGWQSISCELTPGDDLEPLVAMLWEVGRSFGTGKKERVLKALRVLDRLESLRRLSATRRQEALTAAGSALFGEWVRRDNKPVVVFLRSAHQTGAVVLSVVDGLQRAVAQLGSPVLFVIEAEGSAKVLPGALGAHHGQAARIDLPPLTERQTSLLVGALLHRRPPPPVMARRIHRATGGLTEYIEDAVRDMVASGSLRPRGRDLSRLEWAGKEDLSIPIPAQARTSLLDDLATVPADGRRVLEALVLMEGSAGVSTLARAVDRRPLELQFTLDDLVNRGWISVGGEQVSWQILLSAQVVREQLHPCRAHVLRCRLIEALEDGPPVGVLVRLLLDSGRLDDAVLSALKWVPTALLDNQPATALENLDPLMERLDEATGLRDNDLARLHLLYATCLLETRPTDPETGRSISEAAQFGSGGMFHADLALVRARTQRVIGHYPNFRRFLTDGWKVIEKAPPPRLAGTMCRYLSESYLMTGEMDEAREWHERARDLARRSRDAVQIAYADTSAAVWLHARGRLREAEAKAASSASVFEREGDIRGLTHALDAWAEALRHQGRYSEALERVERLTPSLAQGQAPSLYVRLLMTTAWCEVDLCRLGRAQECVDELAATLRRGEYLHVRLQADLVRGRILVASGLLTDAVDVLSEVVQRGESAGLVVVTEHARALLAEARWLLGQHGTAGKTYFAALERLQASGHISRLLEACISQARVMATAIDPEGIFAPVVDNLQQQPYYPARLERILARGRYQVARGGTGAGAWRAAKQQLDLIGNRLSDTDRAALRLHPWSRHIRTGGR